MPCGKPCRCCLTPHSWVSSPLEALCTVRKGGCTLRLRSSYRIPTVHELSATDMPKAYVFRGTKEITGKEVRNAMWILYDIVCYNVERWLLGVKFVSSIHKGET